MEVNQIIHGDCLQVLHTFPSNVVDSVVTDPPYGVSREPNIREVLEKWLAGEDYTYRGSGFMGKTWDSFVPGPSIWREVYRVLKPGGHALVFAGTRTQDLMTISLRLAGFEVRDVIEWLYFSGFPKSLDVGKQFDKRKGGASFVHEFAKLIKKKRLEKGYSLVFMDKEVCGGTTNYSWFEGRPAGVRLPQLKEYYKIKELLDLDDTYDEMMEEAEREKIGEKKSGIANAFGDGKWKSGPAEVVDITAPATDLAKKWDGWGTALKPAHEPIVLARKPISEKTIADNVLKWGTGGINIDDCRIELQEEGEDKRLGGKGTWKTEKMAKNVYKGGYSGECVTSSKLGRFPANVILDEEAGRMLDEQHKGASRFFYCAKASKKERNLGLEDMPEVISNDGRDETLASGNMPHNRGNVPKKNHHPTVKPIKLMEYLITLITPPNGIVLDPFFGSGTTGIAAVNLGFNYIGFEISEEYCKIAEKRISKLEVQKTNLLN